MRNPSTWAYTSITPNPDWLYRGFTGHEHVTQFGLINMNGRMYDPVAGRMLSVDNFTHGGSQGYNRYSYALNNPLRYGDPDGETPVHAVLAIGAAIVGGVMNTVDHWQQIAKNPWSAVGYFAAGAAGGAVTVFAGPQAGFAVTTALNIGTDIASGNVPQINNWKDAAMYAGSTALSGLNAVGAPAIAELGLKALAKNGVSWAVQYSRLVSYSSQALSVAEEMAKLGLARTAMPASEVILTSEKMISGYQKVAAGVARTEGGLNLFKFNSAQSLKETGWKSGDRFLKMYDKGTPKLNWKQNSGQSMILI
jgi:RHS repeat-associated protein